MKRQQIQMQKQLTAYNRKSTHDIFFMTMEWLEKYIEVAGYYPDWENRKQIHNNNVKRLDIIGNSKKAEEGFLTQLFLFWGTLKRNLPFSDELKAEFYQWLNVAKIDSNNCPKRLKHLLYGFNEVLEGRGEKLQEDIENMEEELDSNSPEYMEQLSKIFVNIQAPIRDEAEVEKSLKGKTHKDIEIEKKFGGDSEVGKKIFGQLTGTVSNNDFNFFSQKIQQIHPTNPAEVVQEVKTNPQNWKLNEIATEIDNFGRAEEQEVAVYRQNARLNDFKEGKLNLNNNPIYKWNSFKVQQKFEIKNTLTENKVYLNKTYLTDDEISFVIKEFVDNPSIWRIEPIQGHECLIHSSARGNNNREIGTLIHDKGKFSSQERKEINEILELNNQYRVVLSKLKGEIPLEQQETREALEIWAKELEKKLLINGIRKNADKWEIRKEIVVLEFNEGEVLARKTAKINVDEDYDLTGGLINKSNEFYSLDYFDDKEQAEINSILTAYRVIEKINQDRGKDNWMIITVKPNPNDESKNYVALINKSAIIEVGGERKLDINGEYYKREQFHDKEWNEIDGILKRIKLIDEIKQNAHLERLFVINQETGEVSENEDWFIHNQLKREFDSKTGYLIYVPNAMVRAKDLTKAEQKEVGYKLETTQQDQNRPSGSKGFGSPYMWGAFGVISLIGLAFTR